MPDKTKEMIHSYVKTALVIAGIIWASSGYATQVKTNAQGVQDCRTKIDSVEDDVHILQVNQAERIATDKSIASALGDLKASMAAIQTNQNEMKIDISSTKVKVDTLIKDE